MNGDMAKCKSSQGVIIDTKLNLIFCDSVETQVTTACNIGAKHTETAIVSLQSRQMKVTHTHGGVMSTYANRPAGRSSATQAKMYQSEKYGW